jgi:hypothetical protein
VTVNGPSRLPPRFNRSGSKEISLEQPIKCEKEEKMKMKIRKQKRKKKPKRKT